LLHKPHDSIKLERLQIMNSKQSTRMYAKVFQQHSWFKVFKFFLTA